ncbi:MAG: hypothetical protein KGL74_03555, partial [Elusimicrobia bacterium]|nr:hypothetical protein [Elusimicrobiota bacterium]
AAFKPRLMAALGDPDPAVQVEAVGLAWNRLGDPDVAERLDRVERDLERRLGDAADEGAADAHEWLGRVRTGELCGR